MDKNSLEQEERRKIKTSKMVNKKGNFRISDREIEFYTGWVVLEYKDIEDLKYLLAELDLLKLRENKNK